MRPVNQSKIKPTTPEETFASKHAWLLRWALHFSQNDMAAAEDLVQESFVKLLLSWGSLTDVENIEPLLYSYLKYAHLTERRRGQNYSFQSLSTIDFDTLFIRLRMASDSDQLKIQNELRSIVAYLLWRRNTAKFASIFLLRFFLSFFPEDIMRICLISRHAVDLSLRYAREDVKTHLAGESKVQEFPRPRAPAMDTRYVAVSTQEFAEEIRRAIFSAPKDACLTYEQLRTRYASPTPRPIESDLLAHIVTCERCLDTISSITGLPPASKRMPGDALGSAPRARNLGQKTSATAKQAIARVIAESHGRMREIYEHHPNGLMIALNGQVLALRDISSEYSVLKVDTHSIETLQLIEVLSDQGLTLLTLPLLQAPPEVAPELVHEVGMSGGRKVALLIRFTTDGALIQATYHDPSFVIAMEREEMSSPVVQEVAPRAISPIRGGRWDPLRRFVRWIQGGLWQTAIPASALAMILVVAAVSYWLSRTHRTSMQQAAELLQRAVTAEQGAESSGVAGAIHQRVIIRASSRSVERDIYRDPSGHRHPKVQQPDVLALSTKAVLDEAKVPWDDPLSASSFQQWHDHAPNPVDNIERDGSSLLTLHTTTDDPIVRMESLTVRAADFHPVKRSLELRDHEVVEIAELTYTLAPWNRDTDKWFEPDSLSLGAPRTPGVAVPMHVPLTLSEEQLDEAQLQVMLMLNRLRADTERLIVSRMSTGIEVKGVVEAEERKSQLISNLQSIPHVRPKIVSYSDLDSSRNAETQPTGVSALTVVSTDSPMDKYCAERHLDSDRCRRVAYQLLAAATTIQRKIHQIDELLVQFSPPSSLSPEALAILNSLLTADMNDLHAAVFEQESALAGLDLMLSPGPTQAAGNPVSLAQLVRQNMNLSAELVYVGKDPSRPAENVLAELASNYLLMKDCVARLPEIFPAGTTSDRSHAPQP